mmetsp:Transcript_50637/g.158211  ORF Transcript_50637/g.158211 Transcript_50637/m.158211 type:complete len:149 (+) Transcript_50637:419-865(+)
MLTCLQDSDSVRETGLLKQNNLCSLIRMQDQLLCAMFASERSTSELDAETCKTMRTVACNFSLHGKETEQALWLYTFSTLLDHLPSSSTNYSWEESTRPPATSSSSSPSSVASLELERDSYAIRSNCTQEGSEDAESTPFPSSFDRCT